MSEFAQEPQVSEFRLHLEFAGILVALLAVFGAIAYGLYRFG